MEGVRGQRPVADGQHPRAALVGDPHQPPVGGPRGGARVQVEPARVLVGVDHPGLAGGRVGGQVELAALVAGLDQQQRAVRVPAHPRQVRVTLPVPADLGAPGPVQRVGEEPHLGVGGARRGVGHPGRFGRRAGRVGDPPAGHGRVVGPLHQQRRAVRRPPEAARAVHLLGRRELREAVRHRLRLRLGHRPVAAAVGRHHPERAPHRVRDVPAVGRGARVDHRPRHVQLAHRRRGGPAGAQVRHVEPPREGERGRLDRLVHGVPDDARAALPAALAAGPLGGRQLLAEGRPAGPPDRRRDARAARPPGPAPRGPGRVRCRRPSGGRRPGSRPGRR